MAITIAEVTPDYVIDPCSYSIEAVEADEVLDSGVNQIDNVGSGPFVAVFTGIFTTVFNYNMMASAINTAITSNGTITVAGFGTGYAIWNSTLYKPKSLTAEKIMGVGIKFTLTMRRGAY